MFEPRPVNAGRSASLLELDPDLGSMLSAERRAAAGVLEVAVQTLGEGPLDMARLRTASPSHLGLLVLDGVIEREVVVADTLSSELLGAGDVIRPWSMVAPVGLLETTVRWSVLSAAVVALLDRRVAAALSGFPEVYAALVDRLSERTARLATTKAISQTTRVDRRLIALFWQLAERWGRMTPDGVQLPLRLSHRLLAQLVGARRPTTSSALALLARTGELVRLPDGTWLLPGEPLSAAAEPLEAAGVR
jgi:CRP/FNR family transcriptional regulator, cyclic AMP receptor protein